MIQKLHIQVLAFSKLPIRQLILAMGLCRDCIVSKLPIRQLMRYLAVCSVDGLSKLPIRQLMEALLILRFPVFF